jgi:hypothetical protein
MLCQSQIFQGRTSCRLAHSLLPGRNIKAQLLRAVLKGQVAKNLALEHLFERASVARCASRRRYDPRSAARIWFVAPQLRDLRAMKTRPCAPGKINAPPRLTSQNISPAPFRLSLRRGQSFKSTDWKKKKRRNIELGSGFGLFLAAKIEFSYGARQTVNLLALRLQWFESTPTHVSARAILQASKALAGRLASHLQ